MPTATLESRAILARHRFDEEHGLKIEQLQAFVLQKGPALIVTATELAGERFEKRARAFRAMLLSVVETRSLFR